VCLLTQGISVEIIIILDNEELKNMEEVEQFTVLL